MRVKNAFDCNNFRFSILTIYLLSWNVFFMFFGCQSFPQTFHIEYISYVKFSIKFDCYRKIVASILPQMTSIQKNGSSRIAFHIHFGNQIGDSLLFVSAALVISEGIAVNWMYTLYLPLSGFICMYLSFIFSIGLEIVRPLHSISYSPLLQSN